jgi:hypothetical protein
MGFSFGRILCHEARESKNGELSLAVCHSLPADSLHARFGVPVDDNAVVLRRRSHLHRARLLRTIVEKIRSSPW